MKEIVIYTDGACSGNPGPGGWGAILEYNGKRRELSGGEAQTTNNRMELLGVINALEALKEPCKVKLYSDSQYICNAINQKWLENWKKRGWKRKDGELKNPDLWKRLDELIKIQEVEFIWVKGHADNEGNNRAMSLLLLNAINTLYKAQCYRKAWNK